MRDDLADRVTRAEEQLRAHSELHKLHEENFLRLEASLSSLEGKVATRDDVRAINDSINNTLTEALQSVPAHTANQLARMGNIWLAVSAIATIAMVMIAIFFHSMG